MFRFAVLLLSGLIFCSVGAQAQQPLKLMANTSPPYADERLPERGLALELVEHVFADTDVEPSIAIERGVGRGRTYNFLVGSTISIFPE